MPVGGWDFLPTFAEWAGVPRDRLPGNLEGGSLAALLSAAQRVLSTLVGGAGKNASYPFVGEMGALLESSRGVLIAYGERDIGPIAEFEEHFGKIVLLP